MKKTGFVIGFIVLMLLSSCKWKSYMSELNSIESYIDVFPDSAYSRLNEIPRSLLENTEAQAKYALLMTYAMDKCNVPEYPDSMINIAFSYYENNGTFEDKALSHYVSGRMNYLNDDYEEAFKEFIKAKSFADRVDKPYLNGLIRYYLAELYQYNSEFSSSDNSILEAIKIFDSIGADHGKALSISLLARNYLLSKDYGNALYNYTLALNIYKEIGDVENILSMSAAISSLYLLQLKEPSKALSSLTDAHRQYSDGEIPLDHYPLMSYIYYYSGDMDKAVSLLTEYTDNPDVPGENRLSAMLVSANYKAAMSEYDNAYSIMNRYIHLNDSVSGSEVNRLLTEVEKKYARQELERENADLRRRMIYQVVIGLLLLLVCAFVIIRIVGGRRKMKSEQERLLAEREDLIKDIEEAKEKLTELIDEKAVRDPRLSTVINNRVTSLQKLLDVIEIHNNNPGLFQEKIKKIVIEEDRDAFFEEVQSLVNQDFYGIADFLRSKSPDLKEDEITICCLLCVGFSNSQIGILFGHTNSGSIFTKRHKIRKKLGLWPNYESLEEYLDDMIKDLREKSK